VEVTSLKLPKASDQLGKVNQASEKASNDILNMVDGMNASIDSLVAANPTQTVMESVRRTADAVHHSVKTLCAKFNGDEQATDLLNIWDLHYQSLKAISPDSHVANTLAKLQEDCTNIMLAMQVQDITGQQIATVIGLMQAIDDVLRKLLANFSDSVQALQSAPAPEPDRTFDVGASERQKMVDALLEKARIKDN